MVENKHFFLRADCKLTNIEEMMELENYHLELIISCFMQESP